jgi:hypothetical protein
MTQDDKGRITGTTHHLLLLLQATARRVEGTSTQGRRTEEEDQGMRERMKMRGGDNVGEDDNRDKGEGRLGQDQCTQDDTPIVMTHPGWWGCIPSPTFCTRRVYIFVDILAHPLM